MDINAFNAARAYGAAKNALKPEARAEQKVGAFDDAFDPKKLIGDMAAAIAKSESTSAAYMVGKADPHSVVEALAQAELAVETAVTLRNRVVEAYQELMRMPV